MELAALLFIVLLVLILIGIPISISLGVAVVVTMIINGDTLAFPAIIQRMYVALDSFTLMAIPFFILAGNLMDSGGISKRLVTFFKLLLRRLPAASACITTVSSAFFGAISGSSPATTAAIGSVMLPSMVEDGYEKGEASAIVASSGMLGVIIPPSIPMVTYAVTASVSVSSMFIGGLVPGIMLVLTYIIVHQILYRHTEKMNSSKLKGSDYIKAFLDAIWALGMPIIILGGIYSGIFTPTESAAVACVYSLIVAIYVYKDITFKDVPTIILKSAKSSAAILFIISLAAPFAWLMTSLGIPKIIANSILQVDNKIIIFLIINAFLLFLGCFMETQSIILLVTPILIPIAENYGMDLISLGLIIVVNTAIGMMTPPMAPNIFIATGITGEKSIGPTSRKILPYLAAGIIVLMIIIYVPGLLSWLPSLLS